jgi:hypothetical protein
MKKVTRTILIICFILSFIGQVAAKRSIAVLEIRRGPGASTDNVEFFEEMVVLGLNTGAMFNVKSNVTLKTIVKKLGGCKTDDCFASSAKEVGVELLVIGHLRKQRDNYIASLNIVDTKLGKTVMEISDKLPGDVMMLSEGWITTFLQQLEPIQVAAKKMEIEKQKESKEALNATIIMEDEVFGKFTKEKSPYLLVRNVIVPPNKTLEIEPGVKILIGGDHVSIVVFGQIMASGTKEAPIIFKSAKKKLKLRDWDRIYIRGHSRSFFTYCIIAHSSYGIHADNGNVTITNCRFLDNSMSSVYALQSDVQIWETKIGLGTMVGITVDKGSKVSVDGGSISKTTRALVCHPYGKLIMSGTRIVNNDYGFVVHRHAGVKLEDIYVKDNRVGVLAQKQIKKRKLFMIQGNDQNLRVAGDTEMKKHLTIPEEIAAIKVRPKPLENTAAFASGFASLPSRGESFTARMGLLGQVSLGMSYRYLRDLNTQVHKNLADTAQPHQTIHLSGLRPEFQVFMQSKVGDRESNLTLNGYGNYNSERLGRQSGDPHLGALESHRNVQRFEIINLSTKLPGQEIILGDFTHDKSELSIASRQVRGVKYQNHMIKLSRNRKVVLSGMGGQSAIPYEVGLKPDMLDSNTTPERQEWLGVFDGRMDVTRNLAVGIHVIGTRHADDPLFYPGVAMDDEDLYGADPKLKTANWGVNARMFFNDDFSAYAEVDGGYADTLSVDVDSGETSDHSYSKDTLIHHRIGSGNVAGLAGLDYAYKGFYGNVEYIRAQNGFYTGGNPSIKPIVGNLNRLKIRGAKLFQMNLLDGKIKNLELNSGFDWEALGTEVIGVDLDTLGANQIKLTESDSALRKLESDSLSNDEFTYKPTEHKLRTGFEVKLPIVDFSIEPRFSYYFETRTLLKRDNESEEMRVKVDRKKKDVIASEYRDSEMRFQFGSGVVYSPPFKNDYVSNLRFKVDYTGILINDLNDSLDGEPNSTKWDKNDGMQHRVKLSIKSKFLNRQLGNRLSTSLRYKAKKYRDEVRKTYRVMDRFSYKIIRRKLTLFITGYWSKTTMDYTDEDYDNVSELLKVLGGESEIRYALTSLFSVSARGGYEYGYDDAETGGENYKTIFGGLMLNLLF